MASLQGSVDMLFPPAYTNDRDRQAWVSSTEQHICEARRLSSKPVYVFLWPEYHEGSRYRGEYLTGDYWRLQLETAYRLADGVVIFGGYDVQANRPRRWDPRAPWYPVTLEFIAQRLGPRR